jgi:glycosyltransferase involved in cell wall biosynthesis
MEHFKMQNKPRILTARNLAPKEWVNKTTNVYELCSSPIFYRLPAFIRMHLSDLNIFLNKFDIIVGLKLFINRRKFDIIISASANQAVTYSLLSIFNRQKNPLHILEELYLQEPVKFKQKIRPFIYSLFLRKVDYIRSSSTKEIDNFSKLLKLDKEKFWFLPYPSPVLDPGIVTANEEYILSAGKQYRDYSTLVRAVSGTGYKLIIVSDRNSMKDVETCDEATVFYDIGKDEYLNLLMNSKFVVVPLNNDFCSCGQIAILEAMSYGKPVISAAVVGSIDYIKNGRSGLLYEKGNSTDLREKIILLSKNKELRDKIAQEALAEVKNVFNQDVFANSHIQFIEDKWRNIINQ